MVGQFNEFGAYLCGWNDVNSECGLPLSTAAGGTTNCSPISGLVMVPPEGPMMAFSWLQSSLHPHRQRRPGRRRDLNRQLISCRNRNLLRKHPDRLVQCRRPENLNPINGHGGGGSSPRTVFITVLQVKDERSFEMPEIVTPEHKTVSTSGLPFPRTNSYGPNSNSIGCSLDWTTSSRASSGATGLSDSKAPSQAKRPKIRMRLKRRRSIRLSPVVGAELLLPDGFRQSASAAGRSPG